MNLSPTDIELIVRLVRAYGLCPAPEDRPTIEHVLAVFTPTVLSGVGMGHE